MLLSDDADMSRVSPLELGKEALKQGLLSDTEFRAYQYLRDSRNQVVHGSDDRLTPAQAVELASLTESLLETALVRKAVQRQREIETILSDRPLSQGNSNEE